MPKAIRNAYSTLTFNSYGKVRREEMGGEKYVVVPVVLITTGEFSGNHGVLSYTENHLGKFPQGWDNKPVLKGHPATPGGAGRREILEAQSIGILLNSSYEAGKLKSEAWLRESRLSLDPRIMPAIEAGLPIPVSTGLFHDVEVTTNATTGTECRAVCNIVPDHLAILLDEDPACSVTAGAGLLMNSKGEPTKNALVAGDLREQLYVALRNRFVGDVSTSSNTINLWVDDFFFDPPVVIFELGTTLYKLGYSSEGDVVTLDSGSPEKVIRQRQYRLDTGAIIAPTENAKGISMSKATYIAAILAAPGNRLTSEQLDGLDETILSNMVPVSVPPATQNSHTPPTPAKPEFSFQQLLDSAPPNIREMIQDGITMNQAARTQMIQAITQNQANGFTAEELGTMSTEQLRKLHALAVVPAPAAPAAPTNNTAGLFNYRFAGAAGSAAPLAPAPTQNAAVVPLLAPDWSSKG